MQTELSSQVENLEQELQKQKLINELLIQTIENVKLVLDNNYSWNNNIEQAKKILKTIGAENSRT